jgi:hypothetical protein
VRIIRRHQGLDAGVQSSTLLPLAVRGKIPIFDTVTVTGLDSAGTTAEPCLHIQPHGLTPVAVPKGPA